MNIDPLLAFKLLFVPVMIAVSTLISRRLGVGVGGWIAGLPLTSGPTSAILYLQQGPGFAATAALATMTSSASAALFCMVYAHLARRAAWPACVALASLTFALSSFAWRTLLDSGPASRLVSGPGVLLEFGVIVAICIICLKALPKLVTTAAARPSPRWDIPLRMLLATALLLLVTGSSDFFGPTISGLLSTVPIYTTLMAAFAHAQQGPAAATRVLRGVILGGTAFAAFFVVVHMLASITSIWPTYLAASVVAMVVNGALFNLARK